MRMSGGSYEAATTVDNKTKSVPMITKMVARVPGIANVTGVASGRVPGTPVSKE